MTPCESVKVRLAPGNDMKKSFALEALIIIIIIITVTVTATATVTITITIMETLFNFFYTLTTVNLTLKR